MSNALRVQGIRIGARPFFMPVIFSSQGRHLLMLRQHFRMVYKNFTRVKI
jgi:hypothetical protein